MSIRIITALALAAAALSSCTLDPRCLGNNCQATSDGNDSRPRGDAGSNPDGSRSDAGLPDASPDVDDDEDGLINRLDNCPWGANPLQEDRDGDGSGDACDNCFLLSNPTQDDTDANGVGDVCESHVQFVGDFGAVTVGGNEGDWEFFEARGTDLAALYVGSTGNSGDVDLYARQGTLPNELFHDLLSAKETSTEEIWEEDPGAGPWYLGVHSFAPSTNVSLVVAPVPFLSLGGLSTLTVPQHQWRYFAFVADSTNTYRIETAGDNGDADLYIQEDLLPADGSYFDRSAVAGSAESLQISMQAGDRIYIGVYAYSQFSGLTLSVE